VVLPVSDVDRARNFYHALGWQLKDVERPQYREAMAPFKRPVIPPESSAIRLLSQENCRSAVALAAGSLAPCTRIVEVTSSSS
jgi:predicted lactoylglutathione lyase